MERKRITKILGLLLVMFATVSMSAFAGGSTSKTYYAKATATAIGNGKVYVGTTSAAPADEDYQAAAEASGTNTSTGNSANVTFNLYSKATSNTIKFDGWYDNEECTGTALSTANPYSVRITSNSTTEAAPVTKSYYAKFVEATDFYSSTVTAKVVGKGGQVSVSTGADADNYNASESSDSNLDNAESSHTYYLKAAVEDEEAYRFVGWYSDEACENRVSANKAYTYKVEAESQDASNPTASTVYAKFEAIPYYYSSVHVVAEGAGEIYVSDKNSKTDAEFGVESDLEQKVADKAEHTYYLFAQAEDADAVEFDGWYADEECTELLSSAFSYAYKVTSESHDPDEVSAFNVFAKFTERNMYQVRNGDFEKWAASNEPGFGWNSFPSATGSMASTGKGLSPNPSKAEGRNGGSAVMIYSKFAGFLGMGANANGNLTTGCVNMGSMTATDASNHNYSNIEDQAHRLLIIGQPDGVEFYTKYKMGDGEAHQGHANFIIHSECNYIDPEVEDQAEYKIGECGAFIDESEDWIRTTADFDYIWEKEDADATDKYLLINFTTNMTPGGSKGDTLYIDDVRLIYNSELAKATYGNALIAFTDGAASIDELYDESQLALESNGRGATIHKSYDAKTAVLTVTVKGQDYEYNPENVHEYTIQFAQPKYKLTFVMQGYELCSEELAGTTIIYPDPELLEGHTFVWDNDITVMPESDLTITGNYVANTYKVSYYVGGELVHEDEVKYGESITLYQYTIGEDRYEFREWLGEKYETMPAHDVVYNADIIDAIQIATADQDETIYDLNGRKLKKAVRGINIINGKKVIK